MLKHSAVFLCVLSVGLAAIAKAPLEAKPDRFKHVKGCYVSDLDRVIPVGEEVPHKHHCIMYGCDTNFLVVETCSVIVPAKGWKVVKNSDDPYPKCCGTFKEI